MRILLSLLIVAFPVLSRASELVEGLRHRLESSSMAGSIEAGGERIHASATIRELYERRSFEPIWIGRDDAPSLSRDLVGALEAAEAEGLRSSDYHLSAIASRIDETRAQGDPLAWIDLELLMTDAFLLYASHCLAGHLDPVTIDPEWHARRREADLASLLEAAVSEGRIARTLRELLPAQAGYARLRDALSRYHTIAAAGGWPSLETGPTLRKGDVDHRVEVLRRRLLKTGDLKDGDPAGEVFDETLEADVRRFQDRHGLEADGVVGPATTSALRVTVEDRIRQIEVNMERWRWLPQDLGPRHVLVNIADFHLFLFENGKAVQDMRAIVGRDYRRTPVFSDLITYLVLNPSWEVPHKLAVNDVLPMMRKDPEYPSKMGFKILRGWGSEEKAIDPSSVDWRAVRAVDFRYRLRQAPGPKNSLGRIKFMFPNKFNVYLHDTPARDLFGKAERALSSGCIRVERPFDLAEWLLQGHSSWNRQALDRTLEDLEERTVRLERPTPVHILYWTVWIDEGGVVRFRDDIYGRDQAVAEGLAERPPIPSLAGS